MRDNANLLFLSRQLIGRELSARYRATLLGGVWLILQPLLMLVIYTLVFSGIFKVRWGGAETTSSFALVLFAGLIVFTFFSEVLVGSPSLVSSQPNYVKKVVFPIEMLAVVRVASAAFNACIGLVILLIAQLCIEGHSSAWFVLALPVLATMLPMLLGVAWFMSALGVYLPDISQFAGLVASALLFISPIFFPASAMPAEMAMLIDFNPLAVPIEQLRAVTVQNSAPDLVVLSLYFALSCVFAAFALKVFRRLSDGFADVL